MSLRIKELRTKLGLSQRKLAEIAGIPRTNLTEIESHRKLPRQHELEKIAKALNVEIDDLYLNN